MKTIHAIAAAFLVVGTSLAASPEISTILPEGDYQILYSPIKPDLSNRNITPELINLTVYYKNKKPYFKWRDQEVPIFYNGNGIILTIPPCEEPHVMFYTHVFSGSPWSENVPGVIIGRSWTISGDANYGEEQIFKMQQTAKKK
jgi:hypothetical protein